MTDHQPITLDVVTGPCTTQGCGHDANCPTVEFTACEACTFDDDPNAEPPDMVVPAAWPCRRAFRIVRVGKT